MQPIGRLVTVEEVASAVMLCVDNAAVNGQGINVDGGACPELMADLNRINPTSLAKPSGFSHAVVARGTHGLPRRPDRRWTPRARSSRAGWSRSSSRRWPTCSPRSREAGGYARRARLADDLHRRHGRLPRPRPRDRRGLEAARRAPTTPPSPASGSPGCGTPRRSSSSRGTPSCSRAASAATPRPSSRVRVLRAPARAGARRASANSVTRPDARPAGAAAARAGCPGRGRGAAARRSASGRTP